MIKNLILNPIISPRRLLLSILSILGLFILGAEQLSAQELLSSVRGRVVEQNDPLCRLNLPRCRCSRKGQPPPPTTKVSFSSIVSRRGADQPEDRISGGDGTDRYRFYPWCRKASGDLLSDAGEHLPVDRDHRGGTGEQGRQSHRLPCLPPGDGSPADQLAERYHAVTTRWYHFL